MDNLVFKNTSSGQKYFDQKGLWCPKIDPNFLLANIIVKLMAPAFQNTLTFNPDIINYGRFGFLKLDNAVSLLPKKYFFHLISTQNHFLP